MQSDSYSLSLEHSDLGSKFSFIQPLTISWLNPGHSKESRIVLLLVPYKLPSHDPELGTDVRDLSSSLTRVVLSFVTPRGLCLKAKVCAVDNYGETTDENRDHDSDITTFLTKLKLVWCFLKKPGGLGWGIHQVLMRAVTEAFLLHPDPLQLSLFSYRIPYVKLLTCLAYFKWGRVVCPYALCLVWLRMRTWLTQFRNSDCHLGPLLQHLMNTASRSSHISSL